MAGKSSNYTLQVLLKLNDQLSGRLGKSVSALKKFNTASSSALKKYGSLRRELAKPVSTAGLNKADSKLKDISRDAAAALKKVTRLNSALGKGGAGRAQGANPPAPTRTTARQSDSHVREFRQMQRERERAERAEARTQQQAARQAERERRRAAAPAVAARRAPYQTGDWMRDSDTPRDWRRDNVIPFPGGRRRRRREHEEGGFLERAERLDQAIDTGRQIGYAWRERVDSLEKYADAYLELAAAKQKFVAINLSPDENRKAFAAVDQTVASIRGLTRAGTVETLTDLHTALGNLDHAIEALPVASRYRFGVQTLLGDKFSPEEVEQQIQSGFKFLEMIGAVRATGPVDEHGKKAFTHEDQGRMEEYFNRVSQITTATGGRVTPAEMLQMARTGGTAMQGLTLEGLSHLVAPLTELGGGRTGTALQSMFQSFVAARLQQRSLMEFQRLGLLDMKKVEFNKSGIVKRALPGAIPIAEKLQTDPLAFADELEKVMATHGIDTKDVNAVTKEVALLTGNRTASELTSLLINQRDRVVKESHIATGAKDIGGLYTQALDSDLGKLREFEAQWTNFKAEIGKPLVENATGIAQGLMPVAKFFADHPNVTKYGAAVLVTSKALTGLLETTVLIGRAGQGLSAAFGWTRAAAQGVEGVSGRAAGLRGALAGLNNPVAISIGLTAASIFTINEIHELYTLMEEKRRADANLAAAAAGNAGAINMARQEFGREGKPVPNEIWRAQAGGALAKLNADNQMREALGGWSVGSLAESGLRASRFFGGFGGLGFLYPETNHFAGMHRFDPAPASRYIAQQAPELKEPEVMREFRRMLDGLKLPGDQRGQMDKALQAAFPESFARASASAAEGLAKLPEPADAAAASLLNVYNPADNLGRGLGQAQSAAVSFAARVNALDVHASFTIPALPSNTLGMAPKQGVMPSRPPFTFGPPPSAVGSVVHGDGAAVLHRGNVVFPAALSRRAPGDWLDDLDALTGGGDGARDGGGYAAGFNYSPHYGDIHVSNAAEVDAAISSYRAQFESDMARLREQMMGALNDPRRFRRHLEREETRRREVA